MAKKTKSKAKQEPKKSSSAGAIIGLSGATAASIAIGALIKQNKDLKEKLKIIEAQLAACKNTDQGKNEFGWFGKEKPSTDIQISLLKKDLDTALMSKKTIEKEYNLLLDDNNMCKKDRETMSKNFLLCDSKLNECNEAYKMLSQRNVGV